MSPALELNVRRSSTRTDAASAGNLVNGKAGGWRYIGGIGILFKERSAAGERNGWSLAMQKAISW